jgi:GNAT superfamily N-acetyltransferase
VTGAREQSVRPATSADVKPLVAVMARAFYDDPPFIWVLPDPATRLERAHRAFATLTRGEALAHGGLDIALTGSEIAGPRSGCRRATGRRASPGSCARCPHWYLYAIGVDPAWQGKGLAGALLRSRLDQCDRDGQPAYLEATKTTNVLLYQHFGFQPTGNPELPEGAPPLTAMWRPPALAPPAS